MVCLVHAPSHLTTLGNGFCLLCEGPLSCIAKQAQARLKLHAFYSYAAFIRFVHPCRLSIAATNLDRTYGVTLMFEAFRESSVHMPHETTESGGSPGHSSTARSSNAHLGRAAEIFSSNAVPYTANGRGSSGGSGKHAGSAAHTHASSNRMSSTTSGKGRSAEYVAVIQLSQKCTSTNDVILTMEPIHASMHADASAMGDALWMSLASRGCAWMRCTWSGSVVHAAGHAWTAAARGAGRPLRVPAVLSALIRAARCARTRLGSALKVVPRLVHDGQDGSGKGVVVYLSIIAVCHYPPAAV